MDAPAPTASAAVAPAPQTITLRVRVDPPDAKIYLDDALIGAGAFEGALPKDGTTRSIRAESPSYTSRARSSRSTPTRPFISLERAAKPGSAARPAQTPTRADDTPSTPKKPRRDIDSDSPYAK